MIIILTHIHTCACVIWINFKESSLYEETWINARFGLISQMDLTCPTLEKSKIWKVNDENVKIQFIEKKTNTMKSYYNFTSKEFNIFHNSVNISTIISVYTSHITRLIQHPLSLQCEIISRNVFTLAICKSWTAFFSLHFHTSISSNLYLVYFNFQSNAYTTATW